MTLTDFQNGLEKKRGRENEIQEGHVEGTKKRNDQ